MISTDDIRHLLVGGGTVVGTDGDKIGKVGQLFLDDRTGDPEWVTVSTGLFGRAESFVPLADASVRGDEIVVPYDKAKVKGAPRVEDSEGHLSPDEERELYRYYGVADGEGVSASAGTTGDADDEDRRRDEHRTDAATSGVGAGTDRTDDTDGSAGTGGRHAADTPVDAPPAVRRDASDADAGQGSVTTGGARLRRYVVTEEQTVTVPVTREEVRVEPTPGPDDAGTAGERR
ncbi:DUF2382 domain-containing protein [Cellulomonas sp. JZ18]|uniref:DUF2382 domain-containing protein n=1 Tax=Cellulomonas sp. JZ18 TaxID=2654191 RepID=UPI0012D47788|nr:DUF2382 domain-containing protein [Cellulomonas sp. JZ18]QGQ18801.1 DUF2382 domain-containing protein [Cellulomonas sp. JZ18]